MSYPGPWFTPHTTRFGGIDAAPVNDWITSYQGDTWDDCRNGGGPTTVGPTTITAPANAPGGLNALTYQVFPIFTRYTAAQAFSWHPLATVDPTVAFPPYTDVAPDVGRTVVAVQYEATHGTILASPRTEITAVTGGGNLNLPTATMDVYQLPTAVAGSVPGYLWYDPGTLALLSTYRLGSVDSVTGATFVGPTVSPTDSVVVLLAPSALTVTPFPYPTPGASGFQQLAQIFSLVEYTGPRFRFVYDGRPPLAHRQRHDGAATIGAQLAHIGTTGGRPPLAWRQNNP